MAEENRKVAVITGASSGIGMATALKFADKDYDVVLVARRQRELDKVAAQCEEAGVKALALAADTTDEQALQKIKNQVVETFGHIDIWVNNAGVYLTGKFEDLPLPDMRRIMDVNFFGYVHGSYAALKQFRQQGRGTLINVSSVNAVAPQPYVSIYSASKAAVRALDEALRMELITDKLQDEIHVCTVMPASIDTNLFQNGANYTGQEIQALEPVYDPDYVAKHIVSLAARPRREMIVGPAGKLMALQNMYMPKMYEKRMSKYTEKDLLSETPTVLTDGNLFMPSNITHGIRGGWREQRVRADHLNASLGIGLAAGLGLLGLSYVLLKSNKKA